MVGCGIVNELPTRLQLKHTQLLHTLNELAYESSEMKRGATSCSRGGRSLAWDVMSYRRRYGRENMQHLTKLEGLKRIVHVLVCKFLKVGGTK